MFGDFRQYLRLYKWWQQKLKTKSTLYTADVEATHIKVNLITSTMLVTHYNPIEEEDWYSWGQNGKTEVLIYTMEKTSGIVIAQPTISNN